MALRCDLAGRCALVTGAARGIGACIARRLGECGARVFVFDREQPPAALEAGFVRLDITDAAAVGRAVADLPEAPLLLVNNAGITRDRSIGRMSDEEWRAVIDVNLSGAFYVLRAVSAGMREAGYGRVVNLTSINGLRGKFGQANYTAAKAGLIGLTKTAARELGPRGITVNAVAPGLVMTEMARALPEEVRQRALAENLLGRLAEPDDIADAVLFLLSDAARMITGEVIRVDGGQYL